MFSAGAALRNGESALRSRSARSLRLADFQLEAGEIERGGRDGQARHGRRHDGIAHRSFAYQYLVRGVLPVAAIDAKSGRCIALRIEVDDQHVLANCCERGAKVDRGGRFPHTAFLIGDRDHPRRSRIEYPGGDRLLARRRFRDVSHGRCPERNRGAGCESAAILRCSSPALHITNHDDAGLGIRAARHHGGMHCPAIRGFPELHPCILPLREQAYGTGFPQQGKREVNQVIQRSEGACADRIQLALRSSRQSSLFVPRAPRWELR